MRQRAFTLVELLIVITIVAILGAIAVPKFASLGRQSKETTLRMHLKIVRDGVDRFFAETGGFPERLSKLDDTVLGAANTKIYLPTGTWGTYTGTDVPGPFVNGQVGWAVANTHPQADGTNYSGAYSVPIDPVSNQPFKYGFRNGRCYVESSATGNDSNGVPFSSY